MNLLNKVLFSVPGNFCHLDDYCLDKNCINKKNNNMKYLGVKHKLMNPFDFCT